MNCPLCLDTVLEITFHAGIEVDICPRCRGVWLDRGELDRLSSDGIVSRRRNQSDRSGVEDGGRDDRYRDESDSRDRSGKKKRKKRLSDRLGDVFEEILDL